jgi:hypothetical protein
MCKCKECGAELTVQTSAGSGYSAVVFMSRLPQQKRGRPEKPEGEKYKTPARQLGRVPDAEWNEIQEAVAAAGISLVAWAVPALLKKARREKQQRAKSK